MEGYRGGSSFRDWVVGSPQRRLQLGSLALEDGQPEVALREFEAERARDPKLEGIAFRIGQAYARSGRRDRALDWYRRELEQHPDSQEARDSLTASGRGA